MLWKMLKHIWWKCSSLHGSQCCYDMVAILDFNARRPLEVIQKTWILMQRDHLRSFQKLSLHNKDLRFFMKPALVVFFQRLHLRFDVMHVLTKEFKRGNQVSFWPLCLVLTLWGSGHFDGHLWRWVIVPSDLVQSFRCNLRNFSLLRDNLSMCLIKSTRERQHTLNKNRLVGLAQKNLEVKIKHLHMWRQDGCHDRFPLEISLEYSCVGTRLARSILKFSPHGWVPTISRPLSLYRSS